MRKSKGQSPDRNVLLGFTCQELTTKGSMGREPSTKRAPLNHFSGAPVKRVQGPNTQKKRAPQSHVLGAPNEGLQGKQPQRKSTHLSHLKGAPFERV